MPETAVATSFTDKLTASRDASRVLATATTSQKNAALRAIADSVLRNQARVLEANELDLANGRLDAVTDDSTVLLEWLKTPEGECCKMVGTIKPVLEIHGPGAGIAVRKGDAELVEKFNAAIKAIRASGKYKEINDKYFSFDVYGD